MIEATTLTSRPPMPMLHVAKGLTRVVDSPSILRATVGGEFVVAVWFPGSSAGGMAHLRKSPFAGYATSSEPFEAMDVFLESFVSELRTVRPHNSGAVAAVAGGADLIGLLPERSESTLVESHGNYIRSWLLARRIDVKQLDAGGRQGRVVSLHSATGQIKLERLPRVGAERELTAAPAPISESADPRDTNVGLSEIRVDTSPHRLTAVLGSCVGIALYDPTARIGGLAHTMMPQSRGDGGPPGRYVDTAIPALIDQIVASGGNRRNLQAKLVGGARVLVRGEGESCFQIAEQNVKACQRMLGELRIPILERRVGGFSGFRATVDLSSFRLHVRLLGNHAVHP